MELINGIIISVYKMALGLPKNSSNKVCWSFSSQPTLRRTITKNSNGFILKSI